MQILEMIKSNRLFEVEIITIPSGGDYWPISQPFSTFLTTEPRRVARITEHCDQYFQRDFNSLELNALADELRELAQKIHPFT